MTDPTSPPPADPSPGSDRPGDGPRTHWGIAVVPAAALVIGLLLGALVVGVAGGGSSPKAESTVTVTPTPSAASTADTAVIVPRECFEAARTVREVTTLIRENVTAIREFRGKAIIDMLNQLEDLSDRANDQADACSEVRITPSDEPS